MNHFFCSIHQQITVIPKHTTKPEDVNPGIKTKPQHSPGLPENSSKILSEESKNSPKNSVRTVQKQSQKFNSDCLKTISKIHPGLSENSSKNSFQTVQKQSLKFSPDCLKTVPKIPTLSPKILGLKFMASHDLKENPKSLNDL